MAIIMEAERSRRRELEVQRDDDDEWVSSVFLHQEKVKNQVHCDFWHLIYWSEPTLTLVYCILQYLKFFCMAPSVCFIHSLCSLCFRNMV